jgi:transposase
MPYSSSLCDEEWAILEPLLLEILPQKKQTRPANWTKQEIVDSILYQLKNGCNWSDLPKDLPPDSTVYWHYKQWREAGVIETLMELLHGEVRQIDYFKAKPVNIPKITIVLGHGYHIETLITALEKVYPQIMTKIRFQLCKKPSKEEKAAQGKSGFVPVAARWVIERSNAWMERCKILVKNYERTLENATTKLNLCFVRLMLKRLAASP